ncbi:hypothetical protein D3C80_1427510 [compost metagenome]
MFRFLLFLKEINHLKQLMNKLFSFQFFSRMLAVVAHFIALLFIERFSEIMQDKFSPANRCFGIRNDLTQKLFSDFLFGNRFPLKEFFQFFNVFVRIESDTLSYSAITSSPASFLIITFQ